MCKPSEFTLSRDAQLRFLRDSAYFESATYVARYPDVTLTGLDPAEHYLRFGGLLRRVPGPGFDASAYLSRYRDVARRGDNPLVHYEMWGRGEGRLPLPTTPSPTSQDVRVDIVIPVFNARTDVAACLTSVAAAQTGFDVHVLVVNDGSDAETTDYLREATASVATHRTSFDLIEHSRNEGYTRAVNSGLQASDAPYVVTLNSDTIVTDGWLGPLIASVTGEVGLAGPLSNAASWQNVPFLKAEDGSGFAVNPLPDGMTPNDMAALVRDVAPGLRLDTPFLNGFCTLIRRDVLEAVGFMDEVSFPLGYGEENDFCLRAADAGFRLAIVTDSYVFHKKSRSFGHARRAQLSEAGGAVVTRKHGDARFNDAVSRVASLPMMPAVRARLAKALARDAQMAARAGRVLFLLPVPGGGGGAHSVIQEATAMIRLGIDVQVAVNDQDFGLYMALYGDIPEASAFLTGFRPETVVATAQAFDVVVATLYSSVALLDRVVDACPWILPAYYVQDYEPYFTEENSDAWHEARASYTRISDAVLFAKTDWLCETVSAEHGVPVAKVAPSIDHDVYFPDTAPRGDGPLVLSAMVRPDTPRRGPARTMALLAALAKSHGGAIELHIFGCPPDDPALSADFQFTAHGVLKRAEVAALLKRSDVFIDMSDYQAFGRTSLEAMACGALAVVPKQGGSNEYAEDGGNALVVDTFDVLDTHDRISALIADGADALAPLRSAGRKTALRYSAKKAAQSELDVFAEHLTVRRTAHRKPLRPRIALLPALNEGSHVSITGSGYVRLLAPYRQDALASAWDVRVLENGCLPEPGSAQVAILQRDLFSLSRGEVVSWAKAWKTAGGKLIYEIDDDLTDGAALSERGYPDDTGDLAGRVHRYADLADLITVSSPHLAQRFPHHADKIVHVPNYIDERIWDRAVEQRDTSCPVVGYVGTPTHDADLEIVADTVRALEAEGRIRVEVIGAFDGREALFGTPLGPPPDRSYPNFASWVQAVARWDIALVPLADTSFNRSKSNLKFLECAALGAAVICSDTEEYSRVVRHQVTGLLVENTASAWRSALEGLIEDKGFRQRLARASAEDVRARFTVQANVALYDGVLRRAAGLSVP